MAVGIGRGHPIVKGINVNLPDNHFITTCMDGAAERGYMSASRLIHSSRAVPDRVPVLHPPARRTDHRQCGNFRLMRQGLPPAGYSVKLNSPSRRCCGGGETFAVKASGADRSACEI